MATTTKLRITDPALDTFYEQVPDFDILRFDFYNPAELAQLAM